MAADKLVSWEIVWGRENLSGGIWGINYVEAGIFIVQDRTVFAAGAVRVDITTLLVHI